MGSAGWWARGGARAAGVVVGVALVAACNRGRPVLEYDDTVTTVETAEPVPQRGIDQGGAPPPLVRMPAEDGGTAIVPRAPGKMMPADDAAFAPGGSAEALVPADVPRGEQEAVGAAASVPANGVPAALPAASDPVSATANVDSDLEPDAEAKAAGKVEIAPTPAEAAKNALPPATGTAVRTTNPWQKAAPWN